MGHTNYDQDQVRQEIPNWLKIFFTILGGSLILLGGIIIIMYVVNCYPDFKLEPSKVGTDFIIGMGVFIILVVHLPWSKFKFGGFEIEKAIQEQAQDYSIEIEKLEKELNEYKIILKEVNKGPDVSEKFKNIIESSEKSTLNREEEKEQLIRLLSKWPTYGFTASRIITLAKEMTGYDNLKVMRPSQIRIVADELIRVGKVRTRVSGKGNLLYQINK